MFEYSHVFGLKQRVSRFEEVVVGSEQLDGVDKTEIELLVDKFVAEFSRLYLLDRKSVV
nr:hypothetical protein [uncultured Muribaculum sp.]